MRKMRLPFIDSDLLYKGALSGKCDCIISSVNGRFRVKTTEVRRVHVHSSLLVVTSNQNASNKKKNCLNIYSKPGMPHYIPCMIAE